MANRLCRVVNTQCREIPRATSDAIKQGNQFYVVSEQVHDDAQVYSQYNLTCGATSNRRYGGIGGGGYRQKQAGGGFYRSSRRRCQRARQYQRYDKLQPADELRLDNSADFTAQGCQARQDRGGTDRVQR